MAEDLTKYYRALETADAAGDTVGAQEIANYIRANEGKAAPAPTPASRATIPSTGFNPIESAKNVGKGLASVADIGIEGVSQLGSQLAYPVARQFTSPERAAQLTKPVQAPIGRALGITEDPAYKAEALRRGIGAVGETVGPTIEKGIKKTSEVTGLPEQDVANMAANASLLIPGVGPRALRAGAKEVVEATKPIVAAVGETAPVQGIKNVAGEVLAPREKVMAGALREPGLTEGQIRARQSTMSGVGAATPEQAELRIARAQGLRHPVEFTKGQAGREAAQLQFEDDIAKSLSGAEGAPIIERKAQQNAAILKNLDDYIEEVGAPNAGEFGARKTGESVVGALEKDFATAKADVKAKYEHAKQTNADKVINYTPLNDYIYNLTPSVRDLPPIKAAIEQIEKNNLGDNTMRFNDLQEIYKTINQSIDGANGPQLHYGGELKTIINKLGEELGDNTFREAQAARRKLAQTFQDRQVIENLINTKGRYKGDRKVALEDVYQKSVRSGSLDDLKHLGITLKKTEQGQAAWRDLQAQTLHDIKNSVTKNLAENENGQRIVSASQMDKIIRELDSDGKLEYLFGKKGAQELRDLRDVILDLNHKPIGINTSSTAHAGLRGLRGFIGERAGKNIDIGFGIGTLVKELDEFFKKGQIKKGVEEALNFEPKQLAEELRKSAAKKEKK